MSETVIFDGKQIFVEELIRENARLLIQHEADQQIIQGLRDREASKEMKRDVAALKRKCAVAQSTAMQLDTMLKKALEDLHFVMAGGDPCKVCTVKCAFGEGNCKPVWRGEVSSETEAAGQ